MTGLGQGNNDVTADDDMAFFRTCIRYTRKMSKYDNFEFRQGVMTLVKKYVFKKQQKSKANEKIDSSSHQLKREMPDDSCTGPNNKKVLNVLAKPKITSADEVNSTSADVPIQKSPNSADSGPSMSTTEKSKQSEKKQPIFMQKFADSAASEIEARSGMSQEEVSEVLSMALAKVKKEELENEDDNPLATAFAQGFCGGETGDIVQIDISDSDDE